MVPNVSKGYSSVLTFTKLDLAFRIPTFGFGTCIFCKYVYNILNMYQNLKETFSKRLSHEFEFCVSIGGGN